MCLIKCNDGKWIGFKEITLSGPGKLKATKFVSKLLKNKVYDQNELSFRLE